ncbi:Acg family FMN-binding oxidoreductase [Catellatospora coxensis]
MTAVETNREQVLRDAARTALAAPSVFNTQPWRWHAGPDGLRLYADRRRSLPVADPAGRLLTVSCGAALHHARTALAAAGHDVQVRQLPDPADPDLLAELRIVGPYRPHLAELQASAAIRRRRTDRRPFTSEQVTEAECWALIVAGSGSTPTCTWSTSTRSRSWPWRPCGPRAAAVRRRLPGRAGRLDAPSAVERRGVPTETTVRAVQRRVPIRDYAPFGGQTMHPGRDTDAGARYLIVFTDDDTPPAWLRAGQALSAVLLTAVHGLGSAPISDVTEVADTRDELRRLLPGLGEPQVCVRVGHAPPGEPPPVTRRSAEESIDAVTPNRGQP